MSLAITAFCTERGMNQSALAQATGLSKGAISNYVRGRNGIEPRNLKKIADALKVSVQDLINYTPAPIPAYSTAKYRDDSREENSAIPVFAPFKEMLAYAQLPFVPVAARATFAELGDAVHLQDEDFDTIAVPLMPGETMEQLLKCRVFEVNGDSMEPTLWHGQRVVVEPVPEGKWEYQSDRVYVISYAGMVVIKRIKTNHLDQHSRLELWSDNEKKGGMKVAQRREIQGIWKVLRLDRAPEVY